MLLLRLVAVSASRDSAEHVRVIFHFAAFHLCLKYVELFAVLCCSTNILFPSELSLLWRKSNIYLSTGRKNGRPKSKIRNELVSIQNVVQDLYH